MGLCRGAAQVDVAGQARLQALAAHLEVVAQVQVHQHVGLHAEGVGVFQRQLGAAHHHVFAQRRGGFIGQHEQGLVGGELAAQFQGRTGELGLQLAREG